MREQAKLNAAYVRNAVKEEKSKQLNKLAEKLKVRFSLIHQWPQIILLNLMT